MKKFAFYRGVLESMGEITTVLELGPSTAKTELSLVLTVGAQAPLTTVTFQLPGYKQLACQRFILTTF